MEGNVSSFSLGRLDQAELGTPGPSRSGSRKGNSIGGGPLRDEYSKIERKRHLQVPYIPRRTQAWCGKLLRNMVDAQGREPRTSWLRHKGQFSSCLFSLGLREMVGAQRFELWTSWSRTMGQRHVYHLQAVSSIAKSYSMLLVIKDFGDC